MAARTSPGYSPRPSGDQKRWLVVGSPTRVRRTMTATGSKHFDAHDRDGRRIRYKTIGDPLGAGSGGTVFLAVRLPDEAEDEEAAADDSRRVAIKLTHAPKWKGFLAEE